MSWPVRIHAVSGTLALVLISTFSVSTLLAEALGSQQTIAAVKTTILWGIALLIPALAIAGATGTRLGRGWRLPAVTRKRRRMAFAAANGALVLIPAAVILALRARSGQIDTLFYVVQTVELIAGVINILLLAGNMRDGFALRRRA